MADNFSSGSGVDKSLTMGYRPQRDIDFRKANPSGGKKSPPPAPQIIYQQAGESSREVVRRASSVQLPQAPQVDYAAQQRQQQAQLQDRRESELRSQATDIIDTRLQSSRSQANLYGTKYRDPDTKAYQRLVNQEFTRLMNLDTGKPVSDPGERLKRKKYEGLKKGRSVLSDPLGNKELLG